LILPSLWSGRIEQQPARRAVRGCFEETVLLIPGILHTFRPGHALLRRGSVTDQLSQEELRAGLYHALDQLGPRQRVLAVPPDFTRFHSQAACLPVSSTTTSGRG